MSFNFFQWLRESVRRSILLGVSDAVGAIGMPPGADEDTSANEAVLAKLGVDLGGCSMARLGTAESADDLARPARRATASAKRLGRGLKDMNGAAPA